MTSAWSGGYGGCSGMESGVFGVGALGSGLQAQIHPSCSANARSTGGVARPSRKSAAATAHMTASLASADSLDQSLVKRQRDESRPERLPDPGCIPCTIRVAAGYTSIAATLA